MLRLLCTTAVGGDDIAIKLMKYSATAMTIQRIASCDQEPRNCVMQSGSSSVVDSLFKNDFTTHLPLLLLVLMHPPDNTDRGGRRRGHSCFGSR